MNDPLYQQDFQVHVHEHDSFEHREIVGHIFGPAGVAKVKLDDGTSLSVDYAESGLLARIELDSDSIDTHLGALIGDERATDARNMRPVHEGRPLPLRSVSQYRGPGQSVQPSTPRTREFGNAVACMSVAGDTTEDRLVRAIAMFELAHQSDRLSGPGYDDSTMFTTFLRNNLGEAAGTLIDGWEKLQIRANQARVTDGLADLLSQVLGSGEVGSEATQRLQELARKTVASPTADAATHSGERVEVRAPGRIRLFGEGQPDRHEVRHAIVSSTKSKDTPISSAPVERTANGWSADLVVPASLTSDPAALASLSVTIIGSEETRPPSFVDAVRLARRAIDSDLDGRTDDAKFEWRETEAEWNDIGEITRANRARAFRKHDIKVDRPRFLHRLLRLSR